MSRLSGASARRTLRRRSLRSFHVTTGRTALVAGAGGIIGHALCHELKAQGWEVTALARRPLPGFSSIPADLIDAAATAEALRHGAKTTHVFYAALSPDPDLSVEAERNGRMLG